MATDFKSAFKSFLQGYDENAKALDAETPYKFQLSQMVSPLMIKEEFNKNNATVYYHPKENAWKELETSSTDKHTHKIPDESQFGEPWSQDNVDNSPVGIYDCAIDNNMILWVWTLDTPYKVVSKTQPTV